MIENSKKELLENICIIDKFWAIFNRQIKVSRLWFSPVMLLYWSWRTIFMENTFCHSWKYENHRINAVILRRVRVVKYARKIQKVKMKIEIHF